MKRRFPAQSPLRRVAASVVAVSALTLTSGCALFNPVQTQEPYAAADGMPADIGDLALRDLLLVSDGEGAAVLSGSALNKSRDEMTVQFAPQGADGGASGGSEITLKPGERVTLAEKGLQFNDVSTEPGRLQAVAVRSDAGGTTIVRVPVLSATGYYTTVTPAG